MMEDKAPDRVWIDFNSPDNQYECDEVYKTPDMVEFIRKDSACVEVKDDVLYQAMNDGYGRFEDFKRDVLMALTIRTVEDVRREVMQAKEKVR